MSSSWKKIPAREMPLQDGDIFPFGKHHAAGTTMQFVPLSSYRYFLTQPWIDQWPAVRDYAQRVIQSLAPPPPKPRRAAAPAPPRVSRAESDRIAAAALAEFRAANPKS